MSSCKQPAAAADLQYALLAPEDAGLLTALVRECYGEQYAHRYFYEADSLRGLMERGLLFCAVATRAGDHGRRAVVAHMAVKLEYPGDRTADNFAGMMLPEYRGQGVLMQLGAVLLPVYDSLQLYGLQTATVTHHAHSQKISRNTGTLTTGCLLADSPGSNADGLAIPHRMPILLQFYRLQALPPRVWQVPLCYRPLLQKICAALQWPVRFADGSVCTAAASVVERRDDRYRGTALLRFRSVGEDLSAVLAAFEAAAGPAHASYIDVPLTDVAAPQLVAAANARGWFFGGLIPGRGNSDFLRLQRGTVPPAPSREGIVDDFSLEVVAAILQDRERIHTEKVL